MSDTSWIDAVEARAKAATPGPWEPIRSNGYNIVEFHLAHGLLTWDGEGGPGFEDDAEFLTHARTDIPRLTTALRASLAREKAMREALKAAIAVAGEAAEEWDKAPTGMRAGKILLALAGNLKRYRADITSIHAALESTP